MLVTFVWRAADPTNVVLISQLVNGWWWNNFADSRLTRLLDTNLYYRTYRVRGDTRFLYRLAPNHSLIHPLDVVDWDAYRAPMQPDPLNSRRYVFPRNEQDPGSTEQIWSMVEMPAAPPQPHITRRRGIPAGQLQAHRLRSDILATEYQVWVYTPPGYAHSTCSIASMHRAHLGAGEEGSAVHGEERQCAPRQRHKHDHRSAPSCHAQCQKRCQRVYFFGMASRRYTGSGVCTGSCASRGARDGGAGRK